VTRYLLATLALLAALCAACSQPAADVTMGAGQSFDPEGLTVGAGETITFLNDGPEVHTVTAYEDDLPEGADFFASGGFDREQAARDQLEDGLLREGETFEVTLDEPGTYRYFCIPHEQQGMRGTITVE
jgi:plastocyanin